MANRNVSQAPIVQTESGQSVNSSCPGAVRFHIANLAAARNYTVAGGVYNDCQDSMPATYAAGSGNAASGAGHSVTITLVETVDEVTVNSAG